MLADLQTELGHTFLSRSNVLFPIDFLPDDLYHTERQQYNAGKLISHLEGKVPKTDKTIIITTQDIYVENLDFVYGVAQKGGFLSVVSLYRLDPRFYGQPSTYKKMQERAIKEAIHELGHTFDLDHCEKKTCVMSFSENITAVDRKEKHFCEDCREKVKNRL